MKTRLLFSCTLACGLITHGAWAAGGETWEVVTRTEMPGMAMPASTLTVCLAKDAEKDPQQLMKQSGDCEISNVKTSGNKTTWNMRCDQDGQQMKGSGEITHKSDSYQGVAHLSGINDGQPFNMTATYSGKRLGAPCDPSAPPVVAAPGMENLNEMMGMAKAQMASEMAEQCEVSRYETSQLIHNRFFGPNAACQDKQKFACKMIAKDAPRKPDVYVALAKHDDTSDLSIARTCGIDMAAATRSICKKVDDSNFETLADYCPAEAAKFEAARNAPAQTAGQPAGSTLDSVGNTMDSARRLKGLLGF